MAISRVAPVGVDVEAMAPLHELDLIADRMLSAREKREVFASADAPAMFTRLWTRKEAIAKAFGVGLRVAFGEIDVLVPATPLLPPALSGDVVLRDVQCAAPCLVSVALQMNEIDLLCVEIPFDLLVRQATAGLAKSEIAGHS